MNPTFIYLVNFDFCVVYKRKSESTAAPFKWKSKAIHFQKKTGSGTKILQQASAYAEYYRHINKVLAPSEGHCQLKYIIINIL